MCSIDFWPCLAGLGWSAAALAALVVPFLSLVILVRRARRLPLGVAGTVGLGLLVVAEAVLLNLLSWLSWVGRAGVLAVQVGLAAVLIFAVVRGTVRPWRAHRAWRGVRLAGAWRAGLALLLGLVLVSALRYAPNNGDSMTYHLARVAHWLLEASVAPYPSGSVRQNVMMPGAEYLLLVLQAIGGTDRLAGLLQAGCYLLVVLSAPWLARLAGASAGGARAAAILVATSPMMLLQASSTQNDLVAAVLAVALVATCLPLAHGARPLPATAVVLAAATAAAALLVKATALLAAVPVAVLAAAGLVRRWRHWRGRLALGVAAGALLLAVPLGEMARREVLARSSLVVPVYPLAGEWVDRGANVLRGFLHHVPVAPWLPEALRPAARSEAKWPLQSSALAAHEDFAGSPALGLAIALALAGAVVRFRAIPARGRAAVLAWAAAWVTFHALFRDNEYLSRLQLPLLALSPVVLVALPPLPSRGWLARAGTAALAGFLVLAIGHGLWAVSANERRPPFEPRTVLVSLDYYRDHGETVQGPQQAALRLAEIVGCKRIGLFMGESGFDYPITWRAMQQGAETRHLVGSDAWPCVVYVEHASWGRWNLPRAEVALDPSAWTVAESGPGGPFLFVRRGLLPRGPETLMR